MYLNNFFGIEQDMIIASVYIPPQQSKFYNDDELEIFEQEITSACCNFDYLYMLGDFNAQTVSDYTTANSFLSEFFDFDQDPIDFYNQKCVLENFGIQLQKNNHGFKLIDICKNNNLTLLNGRYGQDKNVDELTFRESSVIDYAITSSKGVEFLQNFCITEVDRLFSDGHALLPFQIKTVVHKLPKNLIPTRKMSRLVILNTQNLTVSQIILISLK